MMSGVEIEFYGLARLRSGTPSLEVCADTLRQALEAVQRACPALGSLIGNDGRIHPAYLVSINGREFVADLSRSLQTGDHVLILGADAGG